MTMMASTGQSWSRTLRMASSMNPPALCAGITTETVMVRVQPEAALPAVQAARRFRLRLPGRALQCTHSMGFAHDDRLAQSVEDGLRRQSGGR